MSGLGTTTTRTVDYLLRRLLENQRKCQKMLLFYGRFAVELPEVHFVLTDFEVLHVRYGTVLHGTPNGMTNQSIDYE
jgi:hypothetical protein